MITVNNREFLNLCLRGLENAVFDMLEFYSSDFIFILVNSVKSEEDI